MKQVELAKGPRRQVCWIPDEFAKKGRALRILGEDGWTVVSAAELSVSEAALRNQRHALTHHREVTDV